MRLLLLGRTDLVQFELLNSWCEPYWHIFKKQRSICSAKCYAIAAIDVRP